METTVNSPEAGHDDPSGTCGSNLSLNLTPSVAGRSIWCHILANSAFSACLNRVRDFYKGEVEKTFTIYVGLLQVSKLITVDKAPLFTTFERYYLIT